MIIMINEIYSTEYDAMSDIERKAFSKLVAEGGAVTENYVEQGIQRRGVKLILAKDANVLVGVAALKIPETEYRDSIEKKSGVSISEADFPFEVGYVSVAHGQGGRGLGSLLCDFVLRLAGDKGAFATTGTPQMLTSILPHFGFRWVGCPWKGAINKKTGLKPDLHLMVRHSLTKMLAPQVEVPNGLNSK
jgi:hypothetical protein